MLQQALSLVQYIKINVMISYGYNMELRHLRYAIAIADELHFTRAAEKLGIAQPPLSQQIKQLENELGVNLFIRSAHGVKLSNAGEVFIKHARSAIYEAERAAEAAIRAGNGQQGILHIGFTGSASFNPIVTSLISAFRESSPLIELQLTEEPTSNLLDKLDKNVIDVAFMRPALSEREQLIALSLPEECLWVAMPSKHPLASRTDLELIELAEAPFILYPRKNGSLLYDSIITSCRNAGFSPRIVQEAPQLTSTINLVSTGVGFALVPESMCQLNPANIRYVKIKNVRLGRMLWLCQKHPQMTNCVAKSFMSFAEEYLIALNEEPLDNAGK